MIEARADTILASLGVEPIGGGLYPEEIRKWKQRVKKPKKVCKGQGCITKISAYNRDYRGHLETLCYKCRSREGLPPREYVYQQEKDARYRYVCENGHVIAVVGRKDNGVCRECDRQRAKAAYIANAKAANKAYASRESRVSLVRLAELMEERGASFNGIEKKTGISAASVRGYAKVGTRKGYKCPPQRAKMIAGYFRVSVAELMGEEHK